MDAGFNAPPNLTLPALLASQVDARAHDVAFHDGSRTVTYSEFNDLYLRTVGWLETEHIGHGDRIAVWLVNRIDWLALLFAAAHVGATVVSVNTRYRSEEVSHILSRSSAKMLVLQLNFRNIDFPAILSAINPSAVPALETIAVVDADATLPARLLDRSTVSFNPCTPSVSQALVDPEALVILFTTSGTTKGPKLVMHPQRTLVDHALRGARSYQLVEPDSCLLAALPFCGVFGLNAALAAFAAGAPIVIMDTFDAAVAVDLIDRHRVTHTFGGDEMYRRLIDAARDERPFPSARIFGFGAFTSSFSEYARAACERGIPFHGLYGSSEVLALFSMQSPSMSVEQRLEGGGFPVASDALVRIRDVSTGELLPVGERGEIEILAPSNFIGYFGNDEATAEAVLPDGFFRTGDVGYLRGDGSFVYETRMGDAIRLGGFLVSPVEIEDVLKRIDGVDDAQVVAVDIAGQPRAVAFVIAEPDYTLDAAELIQTVKSTVAPFKIPARVWFVHNYPMTQSSNGVKTQRNKLREMAYARLARELPAPA
jgi:fatty-acyl-CoA synthase